MIRPKTRPAQNNRHYYVVPQGPDWWVEDDSGSCLHASLDKQDTVIWAVRAAQHDHARGLDVIVCVEEADGTWKTAWHS